MGSEGPSAAVTTVHITGFKKFHGVSENPTETIVSNLTEYVKKKGLPKGLVIGSCSILDTAGQGALIPLYQTLQSAIIAKESESSSSNKIIWVRCSYILSRDPYSNFVWRFTCYDLLSFV
jgi:pyroglutamyl-peptidase